MADEEKPASAEEAPAGDEAVEIWVFAGLRYDEQDKKLMQLFYSIVDGVVDENKRHVFKKGAVKGAYGGAVYKVTTTKAGQSVWTGGAKGPKYVRRYGDTAAEKKKLAEWEALEEADRAADEAERAFKHDKNLSAFEEALEPIVQAMRKTNWQGRRAILLRVLTHLQKDGR